MKLTTTGSGRSPIRAHPPRQTRRVQPIPGRTAVAAAVARGGWGPSTTMSPTMSGRG
ncbi:hypothetical protein [Amycolatopsis mediterranei]|uniref:hypothetical protein n=1 Tax=Amycolatopsis mediterranei TaxID=33910 RepID=UPI0012BC95C9|nr:hypothetical protein [Amycolatopsis mediterranei]UZF68441.1 hypothetical protein ISP_001515 [Amycolatopsis mediterranei]